MLLRTIDKAFKTGQYIYIYIYISKQTLHVCCIKLVIYMYDSVYCSRLYQYLDCLHTISKYACTAMMGKCEQYLTDKRKYRNNSLAIISKSRLLI